MPLSSMCELMVLDPENMSRSFPRIMGWLVPLSTSGVSYASGRGMWKNIMAFGLASVVRVFSSSLESLRLFSARLRQILPRSDAPSGLNGREMRLIWLDAFRNHSIWDLSHLQPEGALCRYVAHSRLDVVILPLGPRCLSFLI